jgi:hypothetical protein
MIGMPKWIDRMCLETMSRKITVLITLRIIGILSTYRAVFLYGTSDAQRSAQGHFTKARKRKTFLYRRTEKGPAEGKENQCISGEKEEILRLFTGIYDLFGMNHCQ